MSRETENAAWSKRQRYGFIWGGVALAVAVFVLLDWPWRFSSATDPRLALDGEWIAHALILGGVVAFALWAVVPNPTLRTGAISRFMSEGDRLVRVGLVLLAPSLLLFLWWVLLLRPQHEAQREAFDTFRSYTPLIANADTLSGDLWIRSGDTGGAEVCQAGPETDPRTVTVRGRKLDVPATESKFCALVERNPHGPRVVGGYTGVGTEGEPADTLACFSNLGARGQALFEVTCGSKITPYGRETLPYNPSDQVLGP